MPIEIWDTDIMLNLQEAKTNIDAVTDRFTGIIGKRDDAINIYTGMKWLEEAASRLQIAISDLEHEDTNG